LAEFFGRSNVDGKAEIISEIQQDSLKRVEMDETARKRAFEFTADGISDQ
jgi:hypothetical protein